MKNITAKQLEKLQIKNFLTKKMVLENVEVILKTPDLKRKELTDEETIIKISRLPIEDN